MTDFILVVGHMCEQLAGKWCAPHHTQLKKVLSVCFPLCFAPMTLSHEDPGGLAQWLECWPAA